MKESPEGEMPEWDDIKAIHDDLRSIMTSDFKDDAEECWKLARAMAAMRDEKSFENMEEVVKASVRRKMAKIEGRL